MRNAAEAVRQALKSDAGRRGISVDLLISRWVAERFLHRISISPHAARLTLRGAFLFAAWEGDLLRTTVDVDLHAAEADLDGVGWMIAEIAAIQPDRDDGVVFETGSAVTSRLAGGRLPGLRIAMTARVGSARARLKIDLGFGQPIRPGPEVRQYPSLLPGYQSFAVRAYPRETALAEKLAIAVEFGPDNTRLRDYWDVWYITSRYRFHGHVLRDAMEATFADRDAGRMLIRRDGYWEGSFDVRPGSARSSRAWQEWLREHAPANSPGLEEAIAAVRRFALPPLEAMRDGSRFEGRWSFRSGWSRPVPARPSGRQLAFRIDNGGHS